MNTKTFNLKQFFTHIWSLISMRRRWLMVWALIIFVVLLMIELSVGNSYYVKQATILSTDVLLRVTFFVGLILTGCVFSTEIFRGLQSGSSRIDTSTIFISPFQEWLVRWLFQFLSALIIYTITFYLADVIRLVVFRQFSNVMLFPPDLLLRDFFGTSDIQLPVFLLYLFATTFSALGTALFIGRSIAHKFMAVLIFLSGITLLVITIRLLCNSLFNHDGKEIYLYAYLIVSSIVGLAISYDGFRRLKADMTVPNNSNRFSMIFVLVSCVCLILIYYYYY